MTLTGAEGHGDALSQHLPKFYAAVYSARSVLAKLDK